MQRRSVVQPPHTESVKQPVRETYSQRLCRETAELGELIAQVVAASTIRNIDPNRPGSSVVFVGSPVWGWGPSDAQHERARMKVLELLRDLRPRFELLFPHPTPRLATCQSEAFDLLETWMLRAKSDHSVPSSIEAAKAIAGEAVADLIGCHESLPLDEHAVRLVPDTNALIDVPDLATYAATLGPRYCAHVLPVVMRELDELKRGGRSQDVRDRAKKADRYLKGLRERGDVRVGVRVAGDVVAVFEHTEPRADKLPAWLELDVPDDRFVASVLLLQSGHPGSALHVATSDLNMQTKLAAAGIPYLEPPEK
jgi:rRNA-processing protein FCF1